MQATAEVRFPLPFVPEDLGFSGAFFADAGSVWGTDAAHFANAYLNKSPGLLFAAGVPLPMQSVEDSDAIRASVGASLIWASPIGPLRADLGWAILKEPFDQTQVFRFGAATKF